MGLVAVNGEMVGKSQQHPGRKMRRRGVKSLMGDVSSLTLGYGGTMENSSCWSERRCWQELSAGGKDLLQTLRDRIPTGAQDAAEWNAGQSLLRGIWAILQIVQSVFAGEGRGHVSVSISSHQPWLWQ